MFPLVSFTEITHSAAITANTDKHCMIHKRRVEEEEEEDIYLDTFQLDHMQTILQSD